MEASLPLFITLTSNEHEKVQMAAMTASVAAVSERSVEVFVSMNAINVFKPDATLNGGDFSALMHKKNVPNPIDLFEQGKMLGDLKIYACSMALDVSSTELSELADVSAQTGRGFARVEQYYALNRTRHC